ncbi:SHQ1 protein-domain-containing protein [Gymnopilus junonius]|uniref:SHQ1 protein-domain-containing protein n=1 Tax=Gymnopilus junonius TaxID=109634 RepID=A0A9P5NZ72_GYMJU|nr:SHQ1 protein-domain-containing protein [Gymnopilus junonius]
MITPRFSCSQTENAIIVSIHCPSIRAADVEINVDDTLVTIYVNPYFLRLNFSKTLVEDENSSANYDPSSGTLTITLTKENKGETFDDLDLLAKLLAPRKPVQEPPLIEVLSSDILSADDLVERTQALSLEHQELMQAAKNDWQLPQEVPSPLHPLNISPQVRYGFLDLHSGYLKHATNTENEVNELGDDAEVCSKAERRSRRIKHEDGKFDEEHYMADFIDDEYIQELMAWKHPHVTDSNPVQYTEKENMTMLGLPRKQYLATDGQTHDLYLALITLLFSYIYDSRTTQCDPTPESAWTICNLTPAFTSLDPPHSDHYTGGPHVFSATELGEALLPSYRRSLTFPLYRSFALTESCWRDVASLIKKGKRMVTRCLLEMKDILDHHDVYYVYSKIWLDDLCVWVQADADDETLAVLGKSLTEVKVNRHSIGWGLQEIEKAASQALDRETDSDDEELDD